MGTIVRVVTHNTTFYSKTLLQAKVILNYAKAGAIT